VAHGQVAIQTQDGQDQAGHGLVGEVVGHVQLARQVAKNLDG